MIELGGFHHLTAITADAPGNYRFYTGRLGLRLVKKTVNQDDVSAYHLFYADALATPGSDVTFFDWPVGRERRGSGCVVRTGLRVADLEWWRQRLGGEVARRAGREVLDFEDPEGQRLCLVADERPGHVWNESPVPAEHQIRGLGPITLSVSRLEPTDRLLREVLNLRKGAQFGDLHLYHVGADELLVQVEPGLPAAAQGAGGVHHLAFRTPDEEQYRQWWERLQSFAIPNSGPVDRFYFKSLYFREPGGVLFEIATDGPGFTADEPLEALGRRLALPPFLEPRRQAIEAGLKPLST